MPYSWLTLASLRTQLATRLDDTTNVYWSQAELTAYIQESLRCWQGLSGYWRGRFNFNLSQGVFFYDLTAQAGSLIPYTIKDSDLCSVMLFHLLEKQLSGGLYVGTDMFSLADFTNALNNRRNQFLLETGMVLTRSTFVWPAPPISQNALSDRTIDVRRAAWFNTSNVYSTLWRTSEFAGSAFKKGWEIAPTDPPLTYSVAAEPPITMQLIPPPLNVGSVEMLSVSASPDLNPTAGVLLTIPDNFAWVVKFGALADLLNKAGQAQDMPRAAYCEQRWREGIEVARRHTSIVQAAINGILTPVNALQSFDSFNAGWQNLLQGTPNALALASWNLLAVSGPPDANPYSVQCDVVQNAPVPVNPGDQVQIGREELDAVVDYAVHLAMFKAGGQEFLSTTKLYDNLLRLAGVYNEELKASVDFYQPMSNRAIREEILRPRRVPIEMEA